MDEQPKLKGNFVVTGFIHFRSDFPATVQLRFRRDCETDEQPLSRQFVATEEWQPLELFWLAGAGKVGYLVIENSEEFGWNPTKEQREKVAMKVIELTFDGEHCFEVRPGEQFPSSPSHPEELRIRCRSGEAKYVLTAFPR